MKLLFMNITFQYHVRSTPTPVFQNLKLININWRFNTLSQVFHATYRKFLTAIDNIDYHPSQVQNTTRRKRSEEYAVHGHYHSYTRTLTPSEEIFLDRFLIVIQKINPSLHWDLSRIKRFGILPLDIGMGYFFQYPEHQEDQRKFAYPQKAKPIARQTNPVLG